MMLLLSSFNFTVPFTDSVLIFTVLIFTILLVPLLFQRINIPDIIGLILAGALIGPNGLNLILKGEAVNLFGTVGVIYIMFLAGLEIDIREFKRNRNKSVQLGLLSFAIPVIVGFICSYYLYKFSAIAAVLFGSMLATHTLLAYPIVRRLGVQKNEAVTITVGSTLIADMLALLVLAIMSQMVKGELNGMFIVRFFTGFGVFLLVVLKLFPMVAHWFFKNIESSGVTQYLLTLGIVFLSGILAMLAHIEPIVGAFLAGLALNSLVPHNSPLMSRIEFMGNALFIPLFLVSVGMLVNVRSFWQTPYTLLIAAGMIAVAVIGRIVPAYIMQKAYAYTPSQRNMIFGLSFPRAAATLAIVLVATNLGIFNDTVQNASIIALLFTCLAGPLIVERAALKLVLLDNNKNDKPEKPERILVSVSNPATLEHLIDFAVLIKNPESKEPLLPISVITDEEQAENKVWQSRKMLEDALIHIAATATPIHLVTRIDMNPASGIVRAALELLTTDVILGWSDSRTTANTFFGTLLEIVLQKLNQTIVVVKLTHPLNTIKRIVIALPPNVEAEYGFRHCLAIVRRLSKQIGASVLCLANEQTIAFLDEYRRKDRTNFEFSVQQFTAWHHHDTLFAQFDNDDLFALCLGRPHSVSFNTALEDLPRHLGKKLKGMGFIVMYPGQS